MEVQIPKKEKQILKKTHFKNYYKTIIEIIWPY